jgi:hypothetical protein
LGTQYACLNPLFRFQGRECDAKRLLAVALATLHHPVAVLTSGERLGLGDIAARGEHERNQNGKAPQDRPGWAGQDFHPAQNTAINQESPRQSCGLVSVAGRHHLGMETGTFTSTLR